ncbi:TCF25-Rqc1 [Babesia duncani]|uniref:TCF25-Rqc1 n=1 Tax=Babesia duncani TaxID=323732 RepID=A0AAD9PNM6_9APIC|nr:TCF25-Rqc1 [Babesia duncani]
MVFTPTREKLAIYEFSINYANALGPGTPALFWLLPNFGFGLALEAFEKWGACTDPIDVSTLSQGLLITRNNLGFEFHPEDSVPRNGLLLLIRAILQFPQFLTILAQDENTSFHLKQAATCEPFANAIDELGIEPLVSCYVTKCGDYWRSGHVAAFLKDGVDHVLDLSSKPESKAILQAFRDLWIAYIAHVQPLVDTDLVATFEFDLAAHAMPHQLDSLHHAL